VEHLIRDNRPVRNLVASDFILANEVVADYYGLAEKTESGLRFVPLLHGRAELGGVLGQAAILAGLSDGRESNPVKRGAWLARKIIAEPPADPPPNVPALEEATNKLTLRERLERHRNQPGCAQCHAKIDPWGLPLEVFDAGGRLKTEAVDARSTLPDRTEVDGVAGLRRYLTDDRIDQVAWGVLKHLATYACGRTPTYNELEFLKRQGIKLKGDGYRMQDLVRFIVKSPMFLEK
jgi:mono/diheme cytochrome c family protein